MRKDTIYLAGLLHDIGKFIERSKSYKVNDRYKHIRTGHPKHSAQLIENLQDESPFFKEYPDTLVDLVAKHHEPHDVWQKFVALPVRNQNT